MAISSSTNSTGYEGVNDAGAAAIGVLIPLATIVIFCLFTLIIMLVITIAQRVQAFATKPQTTTPKREGVATPQAPVTV